MAEIRRLIPNLDPDSTYIARVRSVSALGVPSTWSESVRFLTVADGEVPNAPQGLSITPTRIALILEWTANTEVDFKEYEYYVSPVNGFTPTEEQKVVVQPGDMAYITEFWNGTEWEQLNADGETPYYVRMRAIDYEGNYSAFSNQVSGIPGGIESDAIISLVADKITTGILYAVVTVSGTIRTASSGARMEMTSSGLVGYANDGTTKNFEYTNVGPNAGSVTIIGRLAGGSIDIGGADNTSFHVDVNGNLWLGAATYAAAPFRVSSTGDLVATSAIITGAITGGTIDIGGLDNTSFHVDSSGNMWLGAATYASAPFRVSSTGAMWATGGTFSGDITGGTITGSVFRTSGTGDYLEISAAVVGGPNSIKWWDSADGAWGGYIFRNSNSLVIQNNEGVHTQGMALGFQTVDLYASYIDLGGSVSVEVNSPSFTWGGYTVYTAGNHTGTGGHTGFSLAGHDHGTDYAPQWHTHSGYATDGHDHYASNLDLNGLYINGTLTISSSRVAYFQNLQLENLATTSAFAIGLNGDSVRIISSSRDYKTDIVDLEQEFDSASIYKLRPVVFSSRLHDDDLGGVDDPNLRTASFIAEEVWDADPALALKNKQGKVQGLNYFAMITYMITEMKKMRQELDRLKDK